MAPSMPQDSSHRAKLLVCFATVYLVWGSTYMVASIGVHALPPLLFGGIRFLCAGILLGLTSLALGNRFQLDATEWRHMFVVAIGNVFIANGATNIAMQHVASNQTAILNASAALWIALLATRGRRAHALDRRTLLGLIIGFAGTVLIIWPNGGVAANHFGYQLLILVAVFSWSASTVYIRNAHSKLDVLTFTSVQMSLGGVMLISAGLATGEFAQWHWSKPGSNCSRCSAGSAKEWVRRRAAFSRRICSCVGTTGSGRPSFLAKNVSRIWCTTSAALPP